MTGDRVCAYCGQAIPPRPIGKKGRPNPCCSRRCYDKWRALPAQEERMKEILRRNAREYYKKNKTQIAMDSCVYQHLKEKLGHAPGRGWKTKYAADYERLTKEYIRTKLAGKKMKTPRSKKEYWAEYYKKNKAKIFAQRRRAEREKRERQDEWIYEQIKSELNKKSLATDWREKYEKLFYRYLLEYLNKKGESK